MQRYIVVSETKDGVTRHLVIDTTKEFGSGNRVIASGVWADPIIRLVELANDADDEQLARQIEAEMEARVNEAVGA